MIFAQVFAQTVCSLDIPFVFLWRRNVLRRFISERANDADRGPAHDAHPTTTAAAAGQRSIRPALDASALLADIARERRVQDGVVAAFAAHCGGGDAVRRRVFAYEDLVDRADDGAAAWGRVMAQLDVWRRSEYVVIRGEAPIRETFANYGAVADRLAGTEFAWMLDS